VVLGFALPVFIVALNTLLQRRTPHRLMGRVTSASDVLLGTPQSGSIALGAVLVTLLSYRSIFWISAAVIFASAVYLMWALRGVPVQRIPEDQDAVAAAAALPPLSSVTPVDPGE
jgi:MFS family permease